MFGVGWTEMLVLGVVALIVIGPKDLPVVMNRLGKAIATIRRMGGEFQRELNKATGLDQVTDLRRSITEPLKQTAAEIRSEFNKPLAGGGVAPSGVIKPKDPEVESVVDAIHDSVGMTPPAKAAGTPKPIDAPKRAPAAKAAAPKPVESPAPAEAMPPATKPAAKPARKPRAKAKPAAPAADAAPAVAAIPKKPAAPRQRRAKTVKPEA